MLLIEPCEEKTQGGRRRRLCSSRNYKADGCEFSVKEPTIYSKPKTQVSNPVFYLGQQLSVHNSVVMANLDSAYSCMGP